MSNEILTITDGTTEIDFLDEVSGFHLSDWNPAIAQYKGRGVFQDSPQADGRRLVDKRFMNAIETFFLKARDVSQDALIYEMQEVRRLFEKAAQYWTSWQNEPVYIKARASNETNIRYAIIHTAMILEDDYPYGTPFLQPQCEALLDDLTMIIERGPWLDNVPGVGACVEIAGYGDYCWPCHVEFNGTTTNIQVSDNVVIQDLHDAAFTVEAWVRADSAGENTRGYIVAKDNNGAVGWRLNIQSSGRFRMQIFCAIATARFISTGILTFGEWHHIAVTWDDATMTEPRGWLDGVEEVNSNPVARNGAVVSDVGFDLYIGNRQDGSSTFDGGIGWTRISDNARYNATFTPPARCVLPDPSDPNTVGQWIGAECSGATIDNQEGTAAIDGTLANGTFDCECEHYYGNIGEYCGPAFLEFNGINSIVTVPDAATIQDLHDAAMTVEGWFRADGWGGGNIARLVSKNNNAFTTGWQFLLDIGGGGSIVADIECAVQDGRRVAAFTVPSGWMHIAFTWDDAADLRPRIWLDGTEATYIAGGTDRNGAIVSDIGEDLTIGNRPTLLNTWNGEIGWVRISNTLRYTATFTPPSRCIFPANDANTVGLWIREGVGATAFDHSGSGNNGVIAAATWGCDCVIEDTALNPTCDDEVYIANKRVEANITNIHYWDSVAGAWSANLMGAALPYSLLPAVPAAGDAVIFGINTALIDSGPFSSLIFDIGTAQVDLTTVTWRYSDVGADPTAWGALTVEDDTAAADAFDTTGVNGVYWDQPVDWTTQNPQVGAGPVLGVTGYWVAAHVVVIGAAPATPTQQNRPVYSVVWPYVEVAADDIGGDIPALLRARLELVSDNEVGNPAMSVDRVLFGLRSLSRGPRFTPFINVADEQNDSGITVTVGAGTAFATDTQAPTGRAAVYTTGAADPLAIRANIQFSSTLIQQYYGTYQAFLRADRIGAVGGTVTAQLQFEVGTGLYTVTTEERTIHPSATWNLLDFGKIEIPGPVMNATDALTSYYIRILASSTDAGKTVTFYDVILMPVDEFAGDYVDIAQVSASALRGDEYIDIDGFTYPKAKSRVFVRQVADDEITAIYLARQPRQPMLQSNARQRVYTLSSKLTTPIAVTFAFSQPWITYSALLSAEQLYLSMRGDR